MATLLYAPEVTVRILTRPGSRGKGRVIDVSEDMISGSTTRVTNGISTANFMLLNQSRKYDGMFSPMDTVVIYLRRIKRPVLKFSGYLDAVPLWSAEPGSIRLTASCSLKRLQHFMWDPTTRASVQLMNKTDPNFNRQQDGGLAKRALRVLNEVAGWPQGQIHIARIPNDWYDKISSLADTLQAEAEAAQMTNAMGAGSYIGGENPLSNASESVEGLGPGTGTGLMPATSGKCSSFGGPGGGAYGNFALTGERGTSPNDGWYCAMRWPYVSNAGMSIPGVNVGKAKEWWRNRRILVVNPKNNKAIVVRAADWGPNIRTGRVIDLAPHALSALGAGTDQVLHMGFAPAGTPLGPVRGGRDSASSLVGRALTNQGADKGDATGLSSGWGSPGDSSNMVQARAAGLSFTVHRQAKAKFEGFVNDLVTELGYHPRVIYGFNNRNIAGTSTISNHAYGAAIDIDAKQNPRYGSASGGPYALPKPPAIIKLARKWGLGWGGEYRNSKDYMHFEVIGAPASTAAAYKGVKAGPVVVAKWTPPVKNYVVTKHFGDGGNRWASGTHSGTDFAVPMGTAIHPVGPGVVFDKGSGDPSYGNHITIDHGNKVYTYYAHMREASPLAIGAIVNQSTVIGHVGMTGNTTGPHVHVELRKGADTYTAATQSGGIERYVLGGANRADPPPGTATPDGAYDSTDAASTAVDITQVGKGLFNAWQYAQTAISDAGILLRGYRSLMNDVPVLATVSQFMQAGMRDFCSAPNGDFIAWFPDYFGFYQQAGKMVISELEIDAEAGPPTIGWDDTNLKTHQFVTSATTGTTHDATWVMRAATTAGIASVEMPELMSSLFNIPLREAEKMSEDFLFRYGARPEMVPMDYISGARQEFFFACHLFQQNWSQQYQATVNLTFMPELFPGMLACLPVYGIQGYIRETTDSWDLGGGGFRTSISAAPWSTLGKTHAVITGLPRGAGL